MNEFPIHFKGLRSGLECLPPHSSPGFTSCGKGFSTVLFFDEEALKIKQTL